MPDSTRRGFLAMTGGGVAAVGAAAAVPAAFAVGRSHSPAGADPQTGQEASDDGPLVAYVNDVSTGEVLVMTGEHEVTVTDRDLAARIARLSRAGA